jgi:hypothetical protein
MTMDMTLDADDVEPSVERRALQHGLRTLLDERGWSRWMR